DLQLIDLLLARNVPQHVLAEIPQPHALVEQCAGGVSEDDLAAVSSRHHARRLVNVEAHVRSFDGAKLAGMKPHTHPELVCRLLLEKKKKTSRYRKNVQIPAVSRP